MVPELISACRRSWDPGIKFPGAETFCSCVTGGAIFCIIFVVSLENLLAGFEFAAHRLFLFILNGTKAESFLTEVFVKLCEKRQPPIEFTGDHHAHGLNVSLSLRLHSCRAALSLFSQRNFL
jgi:hypothetical protein